MGLADEDGKIEVAIIREYVEAQLLQTQINYMDYNKRGDMQLASNEASVMDKLYEFAFLMWDAEIPAPGQGYEPPENVWAEIVKQRDLELIDAAVADLLRRRQEVLNRNPESPVQPTPEPTPNPEPDPEPEPTPEPPEGG